MGSGRFGVVYRGLLTVTEVRSEAAVKEVAVKTMESGVSEEQRIKFMQEAAIMGQFNNPYVVKIYGVLTSNQPVRNPITKLVIKQSTFIALQYMIICELMSTDLHRHLHTLKLQGYVGINKISINDKVL